MRIEIALQPKQKLFRDAMDQYPVTFYGGAKGGGKSHGMRNIFLLRRFQYPGTTGAIFRKTYPELEANHIRPLFQEHPGLREYWNDAKKLLTLPNQSTLQFCHCKSESDVDLYQGREYHDLGIEEAGQWTETMIVRLRGSNRSSKPGIKARMALTGNPGGIGHGYLKRLFIEKRFKPEERAEDYHFIQALVDDNDALMDNDPDYVHRLNAEPNEALRRAYRHGDWDIFAGQFFGEIDRNVHFIDPFPIPEHWSREGAYDFGFNHPAAFGWFSGDGDGNTYMYREFVKAQLRVDEFVKVLKSFTDTARLQKIPAGLDCWAKKSVIQTGTTPTIAEEFATAGIQLSRANTDRVLGANQVRKYLSWRNKASGVNKPKLFIFKSCPLTFDTLTRMQTDPSRPEDVLKVDATEGDVDTGDDCYDMLRYYLMSRPLLADAAPLPKVGTAEWAALEEDRMREALYKQIKEEQDAMKTANEDYGGYYQ